MSEPKDFRTPQARKWADDYIPPETCGAVDDVQNALEHLRDANSQLRHVAHQYKHAAEDEARRRRSLGETVSICHERLAEIRRISRLKDVPARLLVAIDEVAERGIGRILGERIHHGSGAGRPAPPAIAKAATK